MVLMINDCNNRIPFSHSFKQDWISGGMGFSSTLNGDDSDFMSSTAATVYEPSEDTFLMLDALQQDLEHTVLSRLLARPSTKCGPLLVIELGSGAGLIITAIAKALRDNEELASVGTYCVAVDLNPAACCTTAQTSKLNGVQVDIVCSDLLSWMHQFESKSSNNDHTRQDVFGPIDILLFNPPYVRGPSGEPVPTPMASNIDSNDKMLQINLLSSLADAAWLGGGPDGVDVLKRALHQAADLLSERGVFYVLMIDYNYAALVRDEMQARQKRTNNENIIYEENSIDIVFTTFGSSLVSKPLACQKILSRRVPGEQLAVYRIYRPHILDCSQNALV